MTSLPLDTEASPLVEYLRQPPPMYALLLSGPWGVGKSYFWNTFVREKLPGLNRVALTISAAGLTTLEELERALFMVSIQKAPGILRETSGVIGKMALRWAKIDPADIKLKAELKTGRTVICIDDLERFAGEFDVLFGFIVSLVDDAKLHVVLIANEGEADDKYAKVKEKIVGRTVKVRQDIVAFFEGAVNNVGEIVGKSRDALRAYQDDAMALLFNKDVINLRTIRGIIFEMDLILRNVKWPDGRPPNLRRLFSAVTFHIMATSVSAENDALVAECFKMDNIGMILGVRDMSRRQAGNQVGKNQQDSQLDPLEVLIDSLGFFSESTRWPRSYAFADLALGGKLDAEAIVSDFLVFGNQAEGDRALVRLQRRDHMSEEEFSAAVIELEDDIKNNRFTTMMDVWGSWEVIRLLSLQNLTRFTPHESAVFFLSAIENLDTSSISSADLHIYPENRDEDGKLVLDRVNAIANVVSARLESEHGQVVLDRAIAGKGDAQDAFSKSVFAGITPEALFDKLRASSWTSISNMARFVSQRRSLATAHVMFIDELAFANEMVKIISNHVQAKRPMTLADSSFLDLASQFEAFATTVASDNAQKDSSGGQGGEELSE